ncbi:MAG: outer membrane beta-barrel protein [Candidatus Aminicenantes bacterium]|nr:outer membrane beta-barrel protein [Candidatus Aminicenantes bacterium]
MLAVLFVSSLSLAQTTGLFKKGGLYITPQIGFNSLSIPIGASVEYGLTENIGIGGTVTYWGWNADPYGKYTTIILSAEALYHLTNLKLDKIDLYGGAGLGFAINSFSYNSGWSSDYWSPGGSGLDLGIIIGGRYYFSPKMAVSLRIMNSLIGSWSNFGAALGVTFVVK